MNLILLFPDDFTGESRARLTGRRWEHVRDVHRPKPDARLCVGLAGGAVGTAAVKQWDEDGVELEVRLDRPPPPPLPVILALALPRPKVLRRVLLAAASLGVKAIHLFHCDRVEKSYWQSPLLRPEAVREALILGLEQTRDTVLPEVRVWRRFGPFAEETLPGLGEGRLRLAAQPGAAADCPRGVRQPVLLAVGPEGGFRHTEVAALAAAGLAAVSLGERILRVETAVPVLLARLF